MQVIIQMRNLGFEHTTYARMLKPYQDYGLVYHIPPGRAEIELLIDMISDDTTESENFEHLINTDVEHSEHMQPSELYEHIKARNSLIPVLYMAKFDGERFRRIEKVKSAQDLQQMLGQVVSRKLIPVTEAVKKLMGQKTEFDIEGDF